MTSIRPAISIAVKVLNDPKEAEDVLQEVFMQIWNKADAYNPLLGRPASWAVTLTPNKAIHRIRAAQRRSKLRNRPRGGERVADIPRQPTKCCTGGKTRKESVRWWPRCRRTSGARSSWLFSAG